MKGTVSGLLLSVLVWTAPAASASDATEQAGDVLAVALPLCAFAATAYHRDGEGTFEYGKALLTTLGVTYALKYSVDKERPDGSDNHSFPSAHAATAFSGASFLQKRYRMSYGIPAYLAAGYVGWSRIDAKAHDGWDVLAGAAIGIVSTYLFTDFFGEKTALLPVIGDNTYALVFRSKF